MQNSLSSRLLATLRTDCKISADDLILVGVSGGVDSIFLLHQLHELGQPVMAAVFHHRLRPEADEECDFVADFCAERGILCVRGCGDTPAYAEATGMGIEAAARELRYRFLFETAAKEGVKAVAVAHHANDQAETVLMHLLRGSGIDGLCGMQPYGFLKEYSESIPLIRPMLEISRKEILEAAEMSGLQWREDNSNCDNSYTRNRIRNDLIPKLEAEYNPQIVNALGRLAKNAANDKAVTDDLAEKALREARLTVEGDFAEWEREVYCSQPGGVRMRMLRLILKKIKNNVRSEDVLREAELSPSPAENSIQNILKEKNVELIDIGRDNLKEVDKFFMTSGTNRISPFIAGYSLRCYDSKLQILKNIKVEQDKYPQLASGWILQKEQRLISAAGLPEWNEKARMHPEMAFLDADRIASNPYLRCIQPGERFAPYGLGGKTQKLSDFLINQKVPAEYRPNLAVAADEKGILWVPGLRVCNRCALSDATRKILILSLESSID